MSTFKVSLLLISIAMIYSQNLKAGRGEIIKLKAPLFKEPSIASKVLDYLVKGTDVFIHQKHFKNEDKLRQRNEQSNSDQLFNEDATFEEIEAEENKIQFYPLPNFYLVISHKGTVGWIHKDHINLITGDFNDHQYTRENLHQNDETDYRLNEPLLEGHPLLREDHYRLEFNLLSGPSIKENLVYPQNFKEEHFLPTIGGKITFSKRADFDHMGRYYYGVQGKLLYNPNWFSLSNDAVYHENHLSISLAPTFSFESFRKDNILFTNTIALHMEHRVVNIKAELNEMREKRTYSGFRFSPSLSPRIIFENVIKNIDFTVGVQFDLNIATKLYPNKTPTYQEELWGKFANYYELESQIAQTYFVGVQFTH